MYFIVFIYLLYHYINIVRTNYVSGLYVDDVCYSVLLYSRYTSLLLYEPYANVSSQICTLLALRPQVHSNHRVNLSTPRYCQSATFGQLTFCVYPLLFFYGIRV